MAVARRGTQQASTTTGAAVSTLSVSFPGAATAGDAVLVGVTQFISGGVQPAANAVADNQTNSYTQDKTGPGLAGSGDRCGLYSTMNITASGTFTVTFTPSANNGASNIAISEYSAVASTHAAALDVTANAGSALGVTPNWTSGTTAATAQGDEVAVAIFVDQANVTLSTVSPALTIKTDSTAEEFIFSDHILTTTGTQSISWNDGGTNHSAMYDACIATYKGAGGAAAAPQVIRVQRISALQAINRASSFFRRLVLWPA